MAKSRRKNEMAGARPASKAKAIRTLVPKTKAAGTRRTPASANSGGNTGAANLKPWRPGQSGNPRGRPRVPPELRDLARAHTAAAIKALVAIMNDADASASARVAAAVAILDRGHGRPTTEIDLRAGGLSGAPPITTAEFARLTPQQAYEFVCNGGDFPKPEGFEQ